MIFLLTKTASICYMRAELIVTRNELICIRR